MAVRIRVELTYKGTKATGIAIANSGYECLAPEILVPLSFARARLRVRGKGKKEKLIAAAKKEARLLGFGEITVRAVTGNKTSKRVQAILLTSGEEDEILLNDTLIGRLGVDLSNVEKGEWRFSDDPVAMTRPSESKQTY